MANNILMQTLVKAAIPTVEKIVTGGKIDNMLRQLKQSYRDRLELYEGDNVEILVSSELDGCEYLNIVILDAGMRIKDVLYQQKLSEAIIKLLKDTQQCQ